MGVKITICLFTIIGAAAATALPQLAFLPAIGALCVIVIMLVWYLNRK